MAHKYGRKSSGLRLGFWTLGLAVVAVTAETGAQPAAARGQEPAGATKMCVDPAHATLDGWDDRFLELLDLLCHLFGYPNGIQIVVLGEPEDAAQLFLAIVQSPKVPAGTSLAAMEAGQIQAAEARVINATQGVLPTWLAQEMDMRLAEVEAALAVAVQAELEVQRPW